MELKYTGKKFRIPTPLELLTIRGKDLRENKQLKGKAYEARCPFCNRTTKLKNYLISCLEFWLCQSCYEKYKKK